MKKVIGWITILVIALGIGILVIVFYPLIKMDGHSPYKNSSDYPQYPDYQSAYSEKEHIERLTKITESGAWEDVDERFTRQVLRLGDIVLIETEIVYSLYDEDPEFFLIDFTFEEYRNYHTITGEVNPPETNEGFFFGYIQNDEYYIISLHTGQNPWEYVGYANEKKYFGSYNYAVEVDGKMTVVFKKRSTDVDENWFWHTGEAVCDILTEDQRQDLMEYNYLATEYNYVKYEYR